MEILAERAKEFSSIVGTSKIVFAPPAQLLSIADCRFLLGLSWLLPKRWLLLFCPSLRCCCLYSSSMEEQEEQLVECGKTFFAGNLNYLCRSDHGYGSCGCEFQPLHMPLPVAVAIGQEALIFINFLATKCTSNSTRSVRVSEMCVCVCVLGCYGSHSSSSGMMLPTCVDHYNYKFRKSAQTLSVYIKRTTSNDSLRVKYPALISD